jgi:long-chain acyl-CoA synthetase
MPFKIADIFLANTNNKKQFTKPYLRTDQPIQPILGRTLPSLLDEACDRHPNHQAFNQWQGNTWQSQSNQELKTVGEELALGLLEELLEPKDKVALLMHSDRNFLLTDFASSLAGLVTVPIDLTQTLDNIVWILNHSAARVLIVSDIDLLAQIIPYLQETSKLQTILVADIPDDWAEFRVRPLGHIASSSELLATPHAEPTCLYIPMLLCQAQPDLFCPELPQCIQLLSLDEVRAKGRKLWSEAKMQELRSQISPQDLATIVYIPGETGQPKGVMLTHENITANILTTFKNITNLKLGAGETVLSFLPLTHIFARAFIFGHLNYGHSIYFSTPNRAARDFLTVRPTIVATVPRLLEKIAQKIGDRRLKLQGIKRVVFDWAWQLASSYELGKPQTLSFKLQLKLADGLVFAQVRKSFGGRLKYFISGGAALKPDLANTLSAAGMTVLQGYGLTETSSVICCNQDGFNRGGTVGLPIPGVEIAIAPDQEILVKSPYVMPGYYQDPEATRAIIDEQGWLHTGDLGVFTPEGFLTITGNKKNLFKLATGKYVTPLPLEEQVKRSPLVAQAVVVGMHKKFCSMLIFADLNQLRERIKILAGNLSDHELLQQPQVIALYQTLVDEANEQLPRWSKVQQFQLLNAPLTVANGLLDASSQVNRAKVNEVFAREIEALYEFGVSSSEFGVRPKGFLKDTASHIAPLRSASSFEFKGLVKKLNLTKFKDFLGDWRHQNQNRTDHLDIPFIAREDDFSTPNSFQIPFVEREDDLLTPNSELRIPNSFKGETI